MQHLTVPMVDQSDLPCLWGLNSLTRNRSVIDLINNRLHLCGPGDATIQLPPGSTSIALERDTRSGHLLVPCDLYTEAAQAAAQNTAPLAARALHTRDVDAHASSSSSAAAAPRADARGHHRQ